MIAAMLGDGSQEMRRRADGEEFLGFISGVQLLQLIY